MLVTRGFSDVLDIAMERRYDLFDLRLRFPDAGRAARAALRGRRAHARRRRRARPRSSSTRLRCRSCAAPSSEHGVEAVAVCFLHSYVDPAAREAPIAALAARAIPDADTSPPRRTSFRTSASTSAGRPPASTPTCSRSSTAISRGWRRACARSGFRGQFLVMSSSGGTLTRRHRAPLSRSGCSSRDPPRAH